jgi:hypothetical protein
MFLKNRSKSKQEDSVDHIVVSAQYYKSHQDRKCTCYVILWRVRATIVVVEKQ